MNDEGGVSVQERYAKALFMDSRIDKDTADALMRAMKLTAMHMRKVQPPVEMVYEAPYNRRFAGRGRAVIDTIAQSVAPLPAPIRDTWFASVILASFAAGIAYSRHDEGPVRAADVQAAAAGLCSKFPECTEMRAKAAARAANELAISWHQMVTLD